MVAVSISSVYIRYLYNYGGRRELGTDGGTAKSWHGDWRVPFIGQYAACTGLLRIAFSERWVDGEL
jgi:hypothetical protein